MYVYRIDTNQLPKLTNQLTVTKTTTTSTNTTTTTTTTILSYRIPNKYI